MSLPFPKDDNKRKWTCFCCGKQLLDPQEYKNHILQDHAAEEGREFIICPLPRCGFPVRDLRTHFKAKHPTEKEIPKKGQMKALIWKDQSSKDGKLKQRKPKFREGYLISTKNGGKEMHYRSGMECDVYECLEAMQEVVSYSVEPFKVQYTFEGNIHEYNPDLSILFDDGHIEIWEIKPSNQTHLPKNSAKWAACNQYCQARGYNFMVLTEIGMNKLKQKIKNQY
jgi:TnsA endonuclease N terminal